MTDLYSLDSVLVIYHLGSPQKKQILLSPRYPTWWHDIMSMERILNRYHISPNSTRRPLPLMLLPTSTVMHLHQYTQAWHKWNCGIGLSATSGVEVDHKSLSRHWPDLQKSLDDFEISKGFRDPPLPGRRSWIYPALDFDPTKNMSLIGISRSGWGCFNSTCGTNSKYSNQSFQARTQPFQSASDFFVYSLQFCPARRLPLIQSLR